MIRTKALLLLLAGILTLTGCDFSVYKLPLPGGTSVGEDPITVKVMFRDVLDLVPLSTVKVNDVSVGQVTDVQLKGYTAEVTVQLRKDTKLPDNALAEIRQTSLLGEKFVSLEAPPEGGSTGLLQTGDVIGLDRSGRNPEVEEVLGALSLVLNGGGVAQLKTIAQELNLALEGREGAARSVLDQIKTLMTQLDENKTDIVHAIESLNRLAIAVNDQRDTIDAALEELPSALDSLDSQRDDLVKMLKSLDRLSGVGVRVIRASKQSTIETFRQLNPVLTEFSNAGDNFVNAFNVFLTYPFVDEVVGRDPQVARNLHMGDYTNLSIQLDLTVGGSPGGPTDVPTVINPTVILSNLQKCVDSRNLDSDACQKLLATPGGIARLRDECAKQENQNKAVCKELNALPGGPTPSGGGGLPSGLPTLGRAGFGAYADSSAHGPTMRDLMQTYDPALVSLLVPGMVVR